MVSGLQIGSQVLPATALIPMMARYQMLPQLLREMIIDRAIAPIPCTEEETAAARQQFLQQRQLTEETAQHAWMARFGFNAEQLTAIAVRKLKIEKFKRAAFGNKLESHFLKRKKQLEQVIYSVIRVRDAGIAQELYFRVQSGEQSFAELAKEFSEGPEALTGGIVGPVEVGSLHPALAKLLLISQPGQLWQPIALGEWRAIVRLEKLAPAHLNEFMQQRLLQELFEAWLQDQINQIPEAERIAFGLVPRKPVPVEQETAA